MLVLLSPAKSMCNYRATQFVATCPALLDKTDALLGVMKGKSKGDLKAMMSISDDIAALNYDRYQCFISNESGAVENAVLDCNRYSTSSSSASPSSAATEKSHNFKITSLVFDGPAYRGFDAATFTPEQYNHAQQHVRILSGLYGVLKPGDLIQEYRLEMGTRLAVKNTKTLYEYWGDSITDNLLSDLESQHESRNLEDNKHVEIIKKINKKSIKGNEIDTAEKSGVKVVVNLASAEYFKSVKVKRLFDIGGVRVVDCVFKDKNRVTSVYAKRARGLMARFVVTENITMMNDSSSSGINNKSVKMKSKDKTIMKHEVESSESDEIIFQQFLSRLKLFNIEGYVYVPSQSTDSCIVFNRSGPPPVTTSSLTEWGEEVDEIEREGGKGGGIRAVGKRKNVLAKNVPQPMVEPKRGRGNQKGNKKEKVEGNEGIETVENEKETKKGAKQELAAKKEEIEVGRKDVENVEKKEEKNTVINNNVVNEEIMEKGGIEVVKDKKRGRVSVASNALNSGRKRQTKVL